MRLYHGTSTRHLHAILNHGIMPRGKKSKGNWAHSVESSPDHVYLTNVYAVFYACSAQAGEGMGANAEKLAILEIDTTKLLPWAMHPDEDFLFHATRQDFPGPKTAKTMPQRTRWFRNHLADYQPAWTQSLQHLGTCTHEGTVGAHSITRYAVIPVDHPLRWASDPTVSLMNHRIMADYYRALTAHVFGDTPSPADVNGGLNFDRTARMLAESRDGITVAEVRK